MKLFTSYRYKYFSGLVKFQLTHDSSSDVEAVSARVNGQQIDLAIPADYINKYKNVHFGLNTHAIPESSVEIQVLAKMKGGALEISNTLKCEVFNDPLIASYIKESNVCLPVFVGLPIDSSLFKAGRIASDFPSPYTKHDQEPSNRRVSSQELADFDRNGWLVIKELLDSQFVDSIGMQLDAICKAGYQGYVEGESTRLEHLHEVEGAVKALFENNQIRKTLQAIFGVSMVPCQSLSYRYGSQQAVHSDFVHLSVFPENLMCGVWVALEDVRPDSGELVVYSGSHKLPRLTTADLNIPKATAQDYSQLGPAFQAHWEKLVYENNFLPTVMRVKKGDVILWDGNLLHAGSQRLNSALTRKSIVLHYFGEGAYSYLDAIGEIGVSAQLI